MRTLKFHGYGDDTFGEYGVTGNVKGVIRSVHSEQGKRGYFEF